MDLAGIQIILSKATGLDVSVTTRDSLHSKLKQAIEAEAVKIF